MEVWFDRGKHFIIIQYIILENCLSTLPPGSVKNYGIHSSQIDLSFAQIPMTEGSGFFICYKENDLASMRVVLLLTMLHFGLLSKTFVEEIVYG